MSREDINYNRRRESQMRKRRRQRILQRRITISALCVVAVVILLIAAVVIKNGENEAESAMNEITTEQDTQKDGVQYITYIGVEDAPEIDEQLLPVNEYSRPGEKIEPVTGIVIHYVGNPGTTAQNNRNYFEGISITHEAYASSHFVVGLEGEIIQCVPTDEIAFASNSRNKDTIAIETCYPDESGKFSKVTYDSLVHLTAWLMGQFNLEIDQVIRHYDVTGKECPMYYVRNENAWEQFKKDVEDYIEEHGVEMKWQVEQ